MTIRAVAAELADMAARMDEAALEPSVRAIAGAHRVMLYGCGREGLMMRGAGDAPPPSWPGRLHAG